MSFFTPIGDGGKAVKERLPKSFYAPRRPRRLAVLGGCALLVGLAGILVWQLTGFGAASNGNADSYSCPDPRPDSERPPAAKTVKINVYNATPEAGLASVVADEMRRRGFTVLAVANDPLARYVPEPFELRAGPKGARQLQVVAAHAPGAVVVTDSKRKDASVDLVVGDGFTRLANVDQAQTSLSGPQGPPGIYCPGLEVPSAAASPAG